MPRPRQTIGRYIGALMRCCWFFDLKRRDGTRVRRVHHPLDAVG